MDYSTINGKKLLCEAVSEFENLTFANSRVIGEKIRLNQRPNADLPLEKAFPMAEKALSSANLLYGGHVRQSQNLFITEELETAKERYFQFTIRAELIKRRVVKDYLEQTRSFDLVEVVEV